MVRPNRLRDLKTPESHRSVPLDPGMLRLLTAHSETTPASPADPVFAGELSSWRRAYYVFKRAVVAAKLQPATIHDLRHSFGVHAAMARVPLGRLQKLMGHASPHMTMRYLKHAPENYFEQDAANVTSSLGTHPPPESQPALKLA
jgi:integrase